MKFICLSNSLIIQTDYVAAVQNMGLPTLQLRIYLHDAAGIEGGVLFANYDDVATLNMAYALVCKELQSLK